MSITEECVVGLFKLSISEQITRQELPYIIMNLNKELRDSIMSKLGDKQTFSGKQLISCLLPADLNYSRATSFYNANVDNLLKKQEALYKRAYGQYASHRLLKIENG